MKKLFISLFLVTFFILESSAQWKPAGDSIKTNLNEQIDRSDGLTGNLKSRNHSNEWKKLIV